jgi:hypothetical protein
LTALAHRTPWLLAGYSPEIENLWKRDPSAVVAAVDQRRREFETRGPT